MNFKDKDFTVQFQVQKDMEVARVKKDVASFERLNFIKDEVLTKVVTEYTKQDVKIRYTSGEQRLGSVRRKGLDYKNICISNKTREVMAIGIFMHEVAHILAGHLTKEHNKTFKQLDKELIVELASRKVIDKLGLTFEQIADLTYFDRYVSQDTYLTLFGAYANDFDHEAAKVINRAHNKVICDEAERIADLIITSIDMDYWQANYANEALDYSYLKQLLNHQTKKYRQVTKHQDRLAYFFEFDYIYVSFCQSRERIILEIDATNENLVLSHIDKGEYGQRKKEVLHNNAEFEQIYELIKEYRQKYGVLDWCTLEY